MPNLRDIRRRIRGVKSTQKVTRAMKIVAAAKLRRAQERMLAARPYATRMLAVLNSLAARSNPDEHPLLAVREPRRVEILILTGDKGFCGAFNANVLKRATILLEEQKDRELTLQTVGRKGRDHFRKRSMTVSREHVDIFKNIGYADAERIARDLIQRYSDQEIDSVVVIYNAFKSMISQRVVVEQLLPIRKLGEEAAAPSQDYIYEPSRKELLDRLLPRHVEYQILRALLESAAAEFAARMTAMDNATRNASDVLQSLTLTMNRVRQAAITKEIIEVVSGAQAL